MRRTRRRRPAKCSCGCTHPRSTISTSGSARACPRCPSRASSARTAPAIRVDTGERVVDQPRHRGGRRDDPRRRRARRRHERRADRGSGDERLPHPRQPLVRGGGGVPARVRDRLPDARHALAPARGRVGAAVGDRQRRLHRRARDREGARCAGRSSPRRATRSSPARGSSAPTPPSTTQAAT